MAESIGERVKRLRERRGWSQRMLGMKATTSGSYISQLEGGLLPRPGMDQLRRIALALEVTLEEVIGDSPIDEAGESWMDDPTIAMIHDQLRRIGELDPGELNVIAQVLQIRREKLERDRDV